MLPEINIETRAKGAERSKFDTDFCEYISSEKKSSDIAISHEDRSYTHFLLSYADTRSCEFWVARDSESGKIIARLGSDVSKTQKNQGSVGLFDCEATTKGKLAAQLLLCDAMLWLKKQGATSVYRPMDFNSWFRYRFKVKESQLETPHFPWEPPPSHFHIEHFKEFGFKEQLKYSSFFFEISPVNVWDAYIARLRQDHSRVLDNGFTISEIRFDESLDSTLRNIFRLLNNAFAQSPMFEEIPFEIFSAMTLSALKSKNSFGSGLCFSKEGDLFGFLFAFVSCDTIVLKTIAVHPYFQSLGIGNSLTLELVQTCKEMGILKSAGALIRSGNSSELMGHGCSKLATHFQKQHYILMQKEPL